MPICSISQRFTSTSVFARDEAGVLVQVVQSRKPALAAGHNFVT
jgi:hypothetical protein